MDKIPKSSNLLTKEEKRYIIRAFGLMSQIGFTIVACVLVGVLLGRFLDGVFGTAPWLVIIFAILGCVSAFKAMVDIAKKF